MDKEQKTAVVVCLLIMAGSVLGIVYTVHHVSGTSVWALLGFAALFVLALGGIMNV